MDRASLGVHRLLNLDRVHKSLDKPLSEILTDYQFSDTTLDVGGELFARYCDGIITLERFHQLKIKYITSDQAQLMAWYSGGAVEVNTIKKLKAFLDAQKNKRRFLDDFVFEKMAFPEKEVVAIGAQSLKKRLAELDHYFEGKKVTDGKWLASLRGDIDPDTLLRVHKMLGELIKTLNLQHTPTLAENRKEVTA